MIKRKKTRTVNVGRVRLGSNWPVALQSMTRVPASNRRACLRQIKALTAAGCDLVRVAVPTRADTAALPALLEQTEVPLIADVHFSPARAVEAVESGIAKIRLNPGNISDRRQVLRIIDAARMHGTAIRIGVNEASIRDLEGPDVPESARVGLMLRRLSSYVKLFESRGFEPLVLSAKSSDPVRTVEVNRRISAAFDYPLHIGLTHAGLSEDAAIPSAAAIGALLCEGIGDTVRVSAADRPLAEVRIAGEILVSLGLRRHKGLSLAVCPTCGRAQVDVVSLARRIKKSLKGLDRPVKLAVMGCVVNGPGEAADADLAVCCGKDKGFIYVKGRRVARASVDEIVPRLLEEIKKNFP